MTTKAATGVQLTALDPALRENPYPDPDRFDTERKDTHHQAFGGARHAYAGNPSFRGLERFSLAGHR